MKKNNIVSLSVHKNNSAQRQRKQRRKKMISSSKILSQTDCTEGFFFLSWNKDGDYQVTFSDPDRVIGYSSLSNYVTGCAQRTIAELDNRNRDDD